MVSVVIPSRNEPYLQNTILDILKKATGDIEVIAVLDGYWEDPDKIVFDDRVRYIHFGVSRGMRNAINSGVAVANGDYVMKCDAHCMFSEGFNKVLEEQTKDNWVVVPRRYALDPANWQIENNPKYPIDYMILTQDLHGENSPALNKNELLKDYSIDDLMSSQGSCWFMKKDYFYELELMDEDNYGSFASEFQEIGLKAWLGSGEVKVNKNCWYAHWHKTEGRGYSLQKSEMQKATDFVENWRVFKKAWSKQTKPLEWLYDKFGL